MKEEILKEIKKVQPTPGRNSMGASESYYNKYYMVSQCFTHEELSTMNEASLVNLVKLADFAAEVFY